MYNTLPIIIPVSESPRLWDIVCDDPALRRFRREIVVGSGFVRLASWVDVDTVLFHLDHLADMSGGKCPTCDVTRGPGAWPVHDERCAYNGLMVAMCDHVSLELMLAKDIDAFIEAL